MELPEPVLRRFKVTGTRLVTVTGTVEATDQIDAVRKAWKAAQHGLLDEEDVASSKPARKTKWTAAIAGGLQDRLSNLAERLKQK